MRRGSPDAHLAFCPCPGPALSLSLVRAELAAVLDVISWNVRAGEASEASLSFHKGDTGLEEKVTSPESRSKPRGTVVAR